MAPEDGLLLVSGDARLRGRTFEIFGGDVKPSEDPVAPQPDDPIPDAVPVAETWTDTWHDAQNVTYVANNKDVPVVKANDDAPDRRRKR